MPDLPHPQVVTNNMRPPVRLGIIGLGAIGGEMLEVAASLDSVSVVVAADPDRGRLDLHRQHHPEIRFSTHPDEVLAADLDAVYIATPPSHHAHLAVTALDRGLSVLCEKPLSVDLEDGQRMLNAANKTSQAAYVNFALSDRNAVIEMARALASDEVGQVIGVDVRLQFTTWPRPFQRHADWLVQRAQGGFLREVFSHFAFLTDHLLGPIQPVETSADFPTPDDDGTSPAETAARGMLRADKVPVHLSAFSGLSGLGEASEQCEWIMWGTRRSYLLRNWDQLYVASEGIWVPVELDPPRGSEATRLERFVTAVGGIKPDHLADFAAAYRVQQVVESFLSKG